MTRHDNKAGRQLDARPAHQLRVRVGIMGLGPRERTDEVLELAWQPIALPRADHPTVEHRPLPRKALEAVAKQLEGADQCAEHQRAHREPEAEDAIAAEALCRLVAARRPVVAAAHVADAEQAEEPPEAVAALTMDIGAAKAARGRLDERVAAGGDTARRAVEWQPARVRAAAHVGRGIREAVVARVQP